ncbi:MAG TPA: BON domain-containing protein [Pyrinomonadaceae bacterium]|nr:BON domain-containing protein [Pyrinomonadaceae bacterium]
MKLFRKYTALGLAIIALSFVSVNAQSFSASGSIRAIEDQVRKRILRLPQYEVFDSIGYRVNGDTVTLFGKVRNAINRSDAARSVKRIAGVSNVVNEIEVLPLGSFDESIRVRLYQTISHTGGLSRYLWPTNPSVRLVVDRGHVSLEGFVSTRGDYNTMNVVAHGVSGVFSVTNNLVVDRERVR